MLPLLIRTSLAAVAAMAVAAAPAVADPETTGGLPASAPPVLSPQGGVAGSDSTGPAVAAQAEDETPSPGEPPPTTPTTTTPETPSDDGDSTVEVSLADPSPASEPTATSPASSGGGLPHTGFALAALVAVGTGFLLTGYALRYSRALDG